MRAVMVTKFVPLPDNSGGRQRSLAFARRLARHGDVVLCAYDDGHADVEGLAAEGITVQAVSWPTSAGEKLAGLSRARTWSAARFCSPRLAEVVHRVAQTGPTDLLLVGYPQLSPLARTFPAAQRVLDFQNVESALVSSYAVTRPPFMRAAMRVEAAALRRLEQREIPRYDVVSVVSEVDRDRLPGAGTKVVVCRNGIDPGPAPVPAEHPVAIFVATMGWAPNNDAALWLGREIWPLVVRHRPDARLLIVGRDPSPEVRRLACAGIEITGTVADVHPYLASARVALAPLRAGGGTRLKILEALAASRPIVATTVGAEGLLDLVGKGVILADDPRAFAAATADLLGDPSRAATLGAAGRRAVVAGYDWESTLRPLFQSVGWET